ncbi:MAG: IS481 family transposase [Mycobacterium sp.]
MFVELSVVEQRFRIVLAVVEDRLSVTEVAAYHGISRQTLHNWLRRYHAGGLAGLVDRRTKPASCPHQMPVAVEVRLLELRRDHPRWGPTRLQYELRRDVDAVPGRTSIYRALVRNGLIEPLAQRRRRVEYRRWERTRAMELWQMDIVGFRLSDGTVMSMLSGIDDHSRFCVCAAVMARADSRSVCAAFSAALARHGVPDQILTDNGKVFTGRYAVFPTTPMFDRICRERGIGHLLAAPYSPTTCGKVERFHRTLRAELLNTNSFDSLAAAQLAIDTYVDHYNTERPHQALAMLTPTARFQHDETVRAARPQQPDTRPTPAPPAARPLADTSTAQDPFRITRVVHPHGTVGVGGAQYNIGRRFSGQTITVVPDSAVVRFYLGEVLLRTHRRAEPGQRYVGGDAKKEVMWRNRPSHEAVS